MGSCSSEMKSSKGIVCDASMNTVSIVTDKNDTLSFSTMDANKEQVDGLLLNDTLEVFYAGKYTPGMQASKLVQYPQAPRLGGDRDEHGCIGSAGYVWCEVQKDCIRLFEKGICTEAVNGVSTDCTGCLRCSICHLFRTSLKCCKLCLCCRIRNLTSCFIDS